MEILLEIQTKMSVRRTRPEEFEERIIFMSIFNDIDWTKTAEICRCHGSQFTRERTSILQSFQCVGSGILEMRNLRMQIFYFARFTSANQLSIYGAAARWCGDLAKLILGQTHMIMEKSVARKFTSRLTEGSGMKFLLVAMSNSILLLGNLEKCEYSQF